MKRKVNSAAAAPTAHSDSQTVEVHARASVAPRQLWRVLADPWTWSAWVSGTRRIRHADPDWPQPGSRLLHRFGPIPAGARDRTTVLVAEPPVRLVVDARAWPWGRVRADIHLNADGDTTKITLREDAISGLLAWFPRVGHAVQTYRNRRSLIALIELARAQ